MDEDLALLALLCRVAEGAVNAVAAVQGASRIALASAVAAAPGETHDAAMATAALLLRAGGGTVVISGTCFAVGSTLFAWLLLRGRLVPGWLARLGVVASLLVWGAFALYMIELSCQIAFTVVSYEMFRPVSRTGSGPAACLSLVGIAIKCVSRFWLIVPTFLLADAA